jgi:hypothetical protein
VVAKWEHARGVHANSEHLLLLERMREQRELEQVQQAQGRRE